MSQNSAVAFNHSTRPVANATLDARGVACPWPVLQARRQLKDMGHGEVLQLVTDCTASVDEVPLWSREAAVELLHSEEIDRGVHEFYLRKP